MPITMMTSDTKLLQSLEDKFGGPVAAARAVPVSYVNWWRWRTGAILMPERVRNHLKLLLAEGTIITVGKRH